MELYNKKKNQGAGGQGVPSFVLFSFPGPLFLLRYSDQGRGSGFGRRIIGGEVHPLAQLGNKLLPDKIISGIAL